MKIVKKPGNKISFGNLFYATQPKDGTFLPVKNMNFNRNWVPKKEGGYSLIDPGSAFEFSRFFNHLWILGIKNLCSANLKIYSDNEIETSVTINGLNFKYPSQEGLFSKIDKSLSNYKIKLENEGSSGQSLHIDYCYYLNDQEITINHITKFLTIARMTNRYGEWAEENNQLYLESKGSSITIEYFGSRFYIFGSTDPYYGLMDIILDNQQIATVSLYSEAHLEDKNFL